MLDFNRSQKFVLEKFTREDFMFFGEERPIIISKPGKAFEMPGSLFKLCNFIKANVPLK